MFKPLTGIAGEGFVVYIPIIRLYFFFIVVDSVLFYVGIFINFFFIKNITLLSSCFFVVRIVLWLFEFTKVLWYKFLHGF